MKTMQKTKVLILLCLILVSMPSLSVYASQATSYTYTINEDGYFARTQDAYLPDKTITELGLLSAEDIFIDINNMLYIADSGNKRIIKYNIDTANVVGTLEYDEFQLPKGLYVTDLGEIYVADSRAKAVFYFDKDFNHIKTYNKPDTPAFSDVAYEPTKITVDNRRNMYIVGEGVSNGIIQLSNDGEFLGYYAVNKTRLTIFQMFQSIFFTRDQLNSLLSRNPPTFSNLAIDNNSIIYTTTMGSGFDGVKKHRTDGGNMFANPTEGFDNYADIWVDSRGVIYTCTKDGYIVVYTPMGEYIYSFGSSYLSVDISGLYNVLASLAVDRDGNIWTIDSYKGYVQSFKPTDYADRVYEALDLFDQGLYEEALYSWTEVLKVNEMSVLAHQGIGKAYLYSRNYEKAMEHFEISGDRTSYSDAYWEVRNLWLQTYLQYVVIIIALAYIISSIIGKFDKERKIRKFKRRLKKQIFESKIIGDVLYGLKVPRHPFNTYYDMRVEKTGTVVGATIIYVFFFITFMTYLVGKGYIYQYQKVENMDINSIVVGFFAILGLFIVCNYLVSSINDGEGSLKKVYMTIAYGAMPCMICMISIVVLSYYLTYNETFVLTLLLIVGIVWSLISIFIGLQTIHDYTFKETVKSILTTILFMMIIAIVLLIVILMWDQVWQFLSSIGKELVRNVIN